MTEDVLNGTNWAGNNYLGAAGTLLSPGNFGEGVRTGGFFEVGSVVRMRDVVDGSPQTLALIETTIGFWNEGQLSCTSYPAGGTSGATGDPPIFHVGSAGNASGGAVEDPTAAFTTPGSWHADGVNAAFVDGHATTLAYSIDRDVYRRLIERNDGRQVEAP